MAEETTAERTVSRLKVELDKPARVNPFSWMVDKICGVTMYDANDPYNDAKPRVVRIALVSLPYFKEDEYAFVEFSSLKTVADLPPGVDPTVCRRTLVGFNDDIPAQRLRVFSEALAAAVKFKPHVICFNEMGLPSNNMAPMREAKELAWQTSQEHTVLVVAGSSHDARTLYNTAYIFRPGGPRDGESFHKHLSARDAGELISAPASRTITAMKFADLRIAMMVCLDVVDYASIASVVKVGNGLDVLLVACYTEKFDDIASIARVASKAMPGTVALVNAVGKAWDARHCHIKSFGRDLEASKESRLKSGAIVSLLKINRADFQAKRIGMMARHDPKKEPKLVEDIREMEYLFGRRDMPIIRRP